MKYCSDCGTKLGLKEEKGEGLLPYCETCGQFRYPAYATAVSMIVLNPNLDKILLIQQYQKKDYILVAGYVNQKESLEDALMRECQEEIGRKIVAYQYMRSEYFEKTNTLLCNFAVVLEDESLDFVSDWEVNVAQWFSLEEAKHAIKPDSLAQRFLLTFFDRYATQAIHFTQCH